MIATTDSSAGLGVGSVGLQLGFVAIATVLIIVTVWAAGAASRACGDSPATAGRRQRRVAMVALAWVAAVTTLAWTGVLAQWSMRPPPMILLFVAIVAGGWWIARSELGDRLARGLPLALLVGVQSFRMPLELVMHRAYTEGVMPEQMSYSGSNFDIVTGATALLLAAAIWRFAAVPRVVVLAWNLLGLALLVNILVIAMRSTPMFEAYGPDHVNTFVTRAPYVLLPTVMVLAAWAGHLVVLRALRRPPDPAAC